MERRPLAVNGVRIAEADYVDSITGETGATNAFKVVAAGQKPNHISFYCQECGVRLCCPLPKKMPGGGFSCTPHFKRYSENYHHQDDCEYFDTASGAGEKAPPLRSASVVARPSVFVFQHISEGLGNNLPRVVDDVTGRGTLNRDSTTSSLEVLVLAYRRTVGGPLRVEGHPHITSYGSAFRRISDLTVDRLQQGRPYFYTGYVGGVTRDSGAVLVTYASRGPDRQCFRVRLPADLRPSKAAARKIEALERSRSTDPATLYIFGEFRLSEKVWTTEVSSSLLLYVHEKS